MNEAYFSYTKGIILIQDMIGSRYHFIKLLGEMIALQRSIFSRWVDSWIRTLQAIFLDRWKDYPYMNPNMYWNSQGEGNANGWYSIVSNADMSLRKFDQQYIGFLMQMYILLQIHW